MVENEWKQKSIKSYKKLEGNIFLNQPINQYSLYTLFILYTKSVQQTQEM